LRLGILEIGIILVFLLIVLVIARIVKNNQNDAENMKRLIDTQPADTIEGMRKKRQRVFKITGLCFVAVAMVFLLTCISLFKWLLWGYTLFFLALLAGLALLFLSRKA